MWLKACINTDILQVQNAIKRLVPVEATNVRLEYTQVTHIILELEMVQHKIFHNLFRKHLYIYTGTLEISYSLSTSGDNIKVNFKNIVCIRTK
jgi:hypothetical protein